MEVHCFETKHYIFHYESGSKAQRDISCIAAIQEASYQHITLMLGVSKEEKIQEENKPSIDFLLKYHQIM